MPGAYSISHLTITTSYDRLREAIDPHPATSLSPANCSYVTVADRLQLLTVRSSDRLWL